VENAVSLYVHIPFCLSKCTYCDFYSVPCGAVPDSYIDALLNEAAFRAEKNNCTEWKTVYVGGGTPSLLTEKQITALFGGLKKISGGKLPDEVTMEFNPCDISAQKLDVAFRAGVTRISCGIQSFNEAVLKEVQRRSSRKDIDTALSCIKYNWKGIFSADMISALPGESSESFASGLEMLAGYMPDHISLYALTVEDGTLLGNACRSGAVPYDYDKADAMWISGRDYLVRNGYVQYEISNFCLRGKECVHNKAYWDQQNYIGCGAGATGTIYGIRDGVTVRQTNTRNIPEYTGFWLHSSILEQNIPAETEYISPETAAFEFFMMGLRTASGVCSEIYETKFGTAFPLTTEELFKKWKAEGKCTITERRGFHYYALTPEGLLFLNEFLESL
jgi:oxygen-independent coproporphyrinogen III oxidase